MNLRRSRVKLLRLAFGCLVLLAMFWGPSANMSALADFACRWVGYLLLMAGLGLRLWSILYVGQRKSHELITTGPYSLCRNPLYAGTVLLTIGAALSFENFAMCLFALAAVIPIHIAVVLAEEKHLRDLFGQEYVSYARLTPRFWFRVSAYKSAMEISISVKVLRRAVIDAIGVLLIPPLADMVDVLQDHGVLPVLWRWP
jgi:protein-S-isoprenylcysteine O-methyltransferase Ste14